MARLPPVLLPVLMTAFVGSMVGVERSVLPVLAAHDFGQVSRAAALSFLVGFGLSKAAGNLLCGQTASRFGYKRLLLSGWLIGLFVPLLLLNAHSLTELVLANVFLGTNQGLCWSSTVLLALAAVPPERRGVAMGVNECVGYIAMAMAAYATGRLAAPLGLRAAPALLGGLACLGGLAFTLAQQTFPAVVGSPVTLPLFLQALSRGFSVPRLAALNQAGLVNNLKDGAAWGLLPLIYGEGGLSLSRSSLLVALYPAVWGLCQLGTGALSDKVGRRPVIVLGFLLQAMALGASVLLADPTRAQNRFEIASGLAVLLGLGTGMVHPTLMAAIGDSVALEERPQTMGVYRMWRDSGYAVGAVLAGILADAFGLTRALSSVGLVIGLSAVFYLVASGAQKARTRA